MGQVYLAEDTKLSRTVALKILPPELNSDSDRLRRFVQEAKTASVLDHPNVAQIFEIGEADGTHFIAMQYVEGETLRSMIHGHPLNTVQLVDVANQVADALQEAHSRGIVHRDLKSSNIMVNSRGQAKVLDFGLAKLTTPSQQDSQASTMAETQSGIVLGTVPYMSPEQALGKKVDSRSDIFSFGIVLYEMATGRLPFEGTTTTEVLSRILQTQPEAISRWNYNVPQELERIIRKCLEKEPERRYQVASDLRIDLQDLHRDLTTKKTTISSPRKSRFRYLTFLVLAALVLLVLANFLFRQRSSSEKAEPVTMAVLPFAPIAAGNELDHLSVGIADALITKLTSVQKIRLCPTSTILRYRNTSGMDIQEVGKALKVENVLSGTIQQEEERFRVNVQLFQVKNNALLWGKQFDLHRQDLLDLEDNIAEEVSRALEIRMTKEEVERLRHNDTQNTQAHESYLLGRAQLLRYNKESCEAAIEAFQEALRLDSNYALAQAGLAIASVEMHLRYATAENAKSWGKRAEKEAYLALKLDPNLAETHLALAALYRKSDFNWDGTIQESRKALQLNPNLDLPYYYIAGAYYHLGLTDLVDAEVQKGLEISEENKVEAVRTQGGSALMAGNYSVALRKLEEVRRLSDKPVSDAYLGIACYYNGEQQRAFQILEELGRSKSASASFRARTALASFYAAAGRKEEAQALIDSVTRGSYMDHHVAYSLGVAFAQLQQKENAFYWLTRGIDSGLPCYPLYANDPLLKPLHSEKEFQELLQNLKKSMTSARVRYAK